MNTGDKVSHSQFGKGAIKKIFTSGSTTFAVVDFGYIQKNIDVSYLTTIEQSVVSKPTSKVSKLKPVVIKRMMVTQSSGLPEATVQARKGIVALRLGQVLESHVLQLSVATEEVESKFQDSLNRTIGQKPSMIMVEGAWGGGKTHLLTLLSSMARKENFAIANVVMDGVGVALADPLPLMESVTSSLVFPDEKLAGGLGAHIANANAQSLRMRGALFLADALEQVSRQIRQEPEVLQVLEDYFGLALSSSQANAKLRSLGHAKIRLPSLLVRRVDDRPARFCDLLCDWTRFAVTMGAQGLLIVLDELDVEYAKFAWWDGGSYEKRRRRNMLLKELGKLRKKIFHC